MAISSRNKRSSEFSSATMSDLVFLLLIFFMLTSTLVSPNAVKLLLPSSTSERVLVEGKKIHVYIDPEFRYFIEGTPVTEDILKDEIKLELVGQVDASVILKADASVPVQKIVHVIDAVNEVNKQFNTTHKVILATKPAE